MALGVVLFVASVTILWIALTPTPGLDSFDTRKVTQSTKIYDRTGKTVLYDLNRDIRRNQVPIEDISPYIKQATIAIEDSNFYKHGGISITGILRSIFVDLTHGSFDQGGSTITQQVVKNSLLTGQKSISRKVHEWILAIKLEQIYSKDQILGFYLNDTPYGGTLYGVEAASRAFFGKSAKDVDLAEAAYIAALPQAPSRYSPYGQNRTVLDTRKNVVLARMKELGYITDAQYQQAKSEVVAFTPQQNGSIIAPHFVFYIEQYLEDKYGPDAVNNGLNVITTLDIDLQHSAETIVSQYAITNQAKFNASNAALVAIDPKTGQILAMVGSRDYFDASVQGSYNDVLSLRQPGSSFKPFVYTAALLKGYTPQTIVFDLPTQFSTACAVSDNYNDTPPCYAPSNFDDKFRGPMTFTTALAQSINVPAVKTLYLAGIQNVINLATSLGITTLGQAKDYGLSFALGAAEVRLLDITSAYGVFANDGIRNPPTGIVSVADNTGKLLEEYKAQPQQVLNPDIAHEMTGMLSDNGARFPEYSADNPLHFNGYDVAAKTGTTNDYRDVWTIGFSPDIVVGTWAGNNDNKPMVKEIAGYVVAPMWHAFMAVALAKYPVSYFTQPPAIPDTAPAALRGSYVGATGVHDILYWVDKDDPQGPPPTNPWSDPQFARWEYPVQSWNGGNAAAPTTTPDGIPVMPVTPISPTLPVPTL
ncbi:MAG: putative penicillin-binding protein [Parcubacteria group bacterium]|nr:putative penicillin-binding protein [Parcubacteria group bacterium]